jgi:hypothetical protein
MRRLTITAEAGLQEQLETELTRRDLAGYVATFGSPLGAGGAGRDALCRIELLLSAEECETLVDDLRREIQSDRQMTLCVETVFAVGSLNCNTAAANGRLVRA